MKARGEPLSPSWFNGVPKRRVDTRLIIEAASASEAGILAGTVGEESKKEIAEAIKQETAPSSHATATSVSRTSSQRIDSVVAIKEKMKVRMIVVNSSVFKSLITCLLACLFQQSSTNFMKTKDVVVADTLLKLSQLK